MKYLVGGIIGSLLTVGLSCGYVLILELKGKGVFNEC